nr:hypothetical protein BaRGS_030017 [Batillaria attramentaria]
MNGADENQCSTTLADGTDLHPPAELIFDKTGTFAARKMTGTSCSETHFQCPGDGYCLPVFLRYNGMDDCPGREDEVGFDSDDCPGFYRCRSSPICVHASHVCDGIFQCPQHDDELLCDLTCPENCTCYGLAFFCTSTFPAAHFPELRFLDARVHPILTLELLRQVQSYLYGRQVQPPFYRLQVQPPFYRLQVQPPFYRRQVQAPFYRRQVQAPFYRRQVQAPFYRRQVQPPFYRRQVQAPFYRRQVQAPFYRRQNGLSWRTKQRVPTALGIVDKVV